MTETETIALLSQVIAETAEELGCENDNEAILQAIHDLKQRPTLPSPPVSGEPVAWLRDAHNGKGDECLVPCAKGDLGGFPVYVSHITNEPVGVTISRELAEDIREALEDLGACADDECTQCKRVLPRLSASITGDKG